MLVSHSSEGNDSIENVSSFFFSSAPYEELEGRVFPKRAPLDIRNDKSSNTDPGTVFTRPKFATKLNWEKHTG